MVQTDSLIKPKVVVVVGPTASGKTSIGVMLAKEFNGEVISADSMQIYKDMNIGTAKVTIDELQGVPHHLLDLVDPTENYSVANWVADAKEKIEDIISRGKTPIIVGGTGLYVTSLLKGYDFFNAPQDDTVRENYRKILQEKGIDSLYQILVEKDPVKAQTIDKNKTKAVIRALEIIDAGKSFNASENIEPYNYLLIGLNHDREILYERINNRVDIMIKKGLIEEFNKLKKVYKLNPSHQSAGAIGYKELFPLISGEVDLNTTINLIKQHSRNYAKRQLTWFRKMENIIWLSPVLEQKEIKERVKGFLGE